MEEYLTKTETARRLSWSVKSLEKRMRNGVFREGVHYFCKPGMGPRFKWSKVVEWLEADSKPPPGAMSWEAFVHGV